MNYQYQDIYSLEKTVTQLSFWIRIAKIKSMHASLNLSMKWIDDNNFIMLIRSFKYESINDFTSDQINKH